jgi:hypothetical protein
VQGIFLEVKGSWQPHCHLWANCVEHAGDSMSHNPMGLHCLLNMFYILPLPHLWYLWIFFFVFDFYSSLTVRNQTYNHTEHWIISLYPCSTEPNAFGHVFGMPLSGEQLGLDFVELRHLLNSYPRYSRSLLVGPDVTRPILHQTGEQPVPYLVSFLAQATNVISAITWHQ